MIDNPLPDQVMEEYDNNYLSEQFYEHCRDKAIEIISKLSSDEQETYYMLLDAYQGFSMLEPGIYNGNIAEKKKDHFFSKRKKVVAKGNTKWAEMLGIKIDHLDHLLAQYCSGGPQLPK